MPLEKVNELYKSLTQTISNFKSPIFKSYFNNKAKEDYNSLISELEKGKKTCVIKKYMNEQSDLLDVLKRQTLIYNMYYDEKSNI